METVTAPGEPVGLQEKLKDAIRERRTGLEPLREAVAHPQVVLVTPLEVATHTHLGAPNGHPEGATTPLGVPDIHHVSHGTPFQRRGRATAQTCRRMGRPG